MPPIELKARAGSNGILSLNVPVGTEEANREFYISVRPVERHGFDPSERLSWKRFIAETAGAWQGQALERPPQGEYEQREALK